MLRYFKAVFHLGLHCVVLEHYRSAFQCVQLLQKMHTTVAGGPQNNGMTSIRTCGGVKISFHYCDLIAHRRFKILFHHSDKKYVPVAYVINMCSMCQSYICFSSISHTPYLNAVRALREYLIHGTLHDIFWHYTP